MLSAVVLLLSQSGAVSVDMKLCERDETVATLHMCSTSSDRPAAVSAAQVSLGWHPLYLRHREEMP